jgi:hypothetical protein
MMLTYGCNFCTQKDEVRNNTGRGGLMSPRKVDAHAKARNKRRPPRGMYLNQDSLTAFVSSAQSGQGDNILKKLEAELVELKRQVVPTCVFWQAGQAFYSMLLELLSNCM